MNTRRIASYVQRLLTMLATIIAAAVAAAPKPTVLCTDFAGDIDDTWALAQLLRSPELDLKITLTETGEADYRAAVAAKYLHVTGNSNVAVAYGLTEGPMGPEHRHQGPWIEGYDISSYPGPVYKDGVSALIELIKESEVPVTIIEIGPAPTLAEALRRAPEIAAKCDFFGMHGSFDVGYGGDSTPSAEYNVKANVDAFRAVMGAKWRSITLTPLDTCGVVNLDGENYHAVWSATDDSIARSLIENYCIWAPRVPWMDCDFFATRSSTLFDSVAVYMAYSEDLINYETIRFSVTDDGFTRRDPNGEYTAKVAISWKDLPAFERHLSRRILGLE